MKFKNLLAFIIAVCTMTTVGFSQAIKVNSDGFVGIRNSSPDYSLDFEAGKANFDNSDSYDEHLRFNLINADPRICSENQVVFYDNNDNEWIDIQCQSVSEMSDSTLKTNFQNLKGESLKKVRNLKGYSFNWKSNPNGKRHAGLLAQQVERVIPEAVSTSDSSGRKSISYSHVIPYLVEAIKQQQNRIDLQEKQINKDSIAMDTLRTKIIRLEEKISLIQSQCCSESINDKEKKSGKLNATVPKNARQSARLYQNRPNPFSDATTIDFYLPEKVQKAVLHIYDMQGAPVKQYSIEKREDASKTIQGGSLKPGMYLYTLIADGKEVDTKRMILTK